MSICLLICNVSVTCWLVVLLQFITAEHADTLLETTRVLGNLTREKDVRDFAIKHRSMSLLNNVYLS